MTILFPSVSTNLPTRVASPTSSVKFPCASTGLSTDKLYFFPAAKSSSPCPAIRYQLPQFGTTRIDGTRGGVHEASSSGRCDVRGHNDWRGAAIQRVFALCVLQLRACNHFHHRPVTRVFRLIRARLQELLSQRIHTFLCHEVVCPAPPHHAIRYICRHCDRLDLDY